jgi:uncharacterized protein (TIGR02145 family)
MKKILAYVMLALIASLWGCSDMGDRDNPTDPSADNYDASLVPGDGNGGGDGPGDGGEGDDGKGSSSSNGISSNSSSSKGSSSSVTPKSSDSETSVSTGTMTDSRDGQTYKTVKIGDQVWMAQNLNYKSDNSYCYNDSAKYCSEYGRLYTWADAMESCPTGWHLPSKDEFVILANIAGGSSKAGKPLMAKDGWNSNGGGYDTYSFAALPGGARNEDGEYVLLGEQGSFWLASEDAFRFIANNMPLYISLNNRGRGLSVRCLKDAGQSLSSSSQSGVNSSSSGKVSVELGTFTDERDEQTYKTVKIGDQVWMAQNLNFKTDSSFCYNDEEANCTKYGRHYKWAAAVGKSESECGYGNECSLPSGDIQGACPSGWHLPSKTEWETLFTTVGGNSTAGKVLKSASGWNNSGNGTDAFEFTVLPAGGRYGSGNYSNEGKSAIFWSSTEFKDKDAYIVSLFYDGGAPYLSYAEKRYGYSVRCIQNTSAANASSSSKNGSSSSAESVSSSSETHPSETSSSSVASSEGASSSDEEVVDEYVYSNTQGWACLDSNDGEMKLGKVDNDVYFVCDAKEWREATTDEEISCRGSGYCKACTENGQGTFGEYEGNSLVCDGGTWRTPNCAETKLGSLCTANDGGVVPECESLGGFKIDYVCSQDPKASNKLVWHPVRSPFEYTLEYWNTKRNAYNTAAVEAGTHSDLMITDPRDGNVYRTIVMNGMRVFAENLRYADSAASKNLIGQTSCYNGESKNCEIGGRYYAWSAAMDLNGKWNSASASSLIGAQHRGICPEGWHIPDTTEWKTMFSAFGSAKPHQVMGYSGWTAATDVSGFTALPIDYLFETGVNIYNGFDYALFWSSSEDPVFDQSNTASYWWFNKDNTHLGGFEGVGDRGYKEYRLSVRCIQDYSVDP